MKTRPLAALAVAAVMLFGATSCGGGKDDTNSGERPSPDQLSNYIAQDAAGVPEDMLNCLAEELHNSDIPNGVLRAWVDGREAEVNEDNIEEYEAIQSEIGVACVPELEGLDLDDIEGMGR